MVKIEGMKIGDLLQRLEQEKWDWSVQALRNFREGFLLPDHHHTEKETLLIAVYGPALIGKTTFILKLLGVEEDKIKNIAIAMLGKRQPVEFSTMTSTIYEKSSNDYFTVIYPNRLKENCNSIEELENAMSRYLDQLEADNQFATEPVRVRIAKTYFDSSKLNNRDKDFAIIDLPYGDHKEKGKHSHLNRMVKEYLERSKLCFLLETAGKMANLTQINNEFIRDWSLLPSQFRVVLNRSVASASIQREIEHEEIPTSEALKNLYKQELGSHLEKDVKDIQLYPLEFGDNWLYIRERNPVLYEQVSLWMDQLFNELEQDILSVYCQENELLQLKKLDQYILQFGKEEIQKLERQKEEFENTKIEHQNTILAHEQYMKELEEQQEQSKSDIEKLETVELEKYDSPVIPKWDDRKKEEKKPTVLDQDFDNWKEKIQAHYELQIETWNQHIEQINQKNAWSIPKLAIEFEEDFKRFSSKRMLKTYFLASQFNKDCEELEEYLKDLNDEWSFQLKVKHSAQVTQINSGFSTLVESMELEIQSRTKKIEELKKQMGLLNQSIAEQEKIIKEARYEQELDQVRSDKLRTYLKQAFVVKSKDYYAKITSPEIPAEEKWLYHQYWNSLKNQLERVVEE